MCRHLNMGQDMGPHPQNSKATGRKQRSEHQTGSLETMAQGPGAAETVKASRKIRKLGRGEASGERDPVWKPGYTGSFYFKLLYGWNKNNS